MRFVKTNSLFAALLAVTSSSLGWTDCSCFCVDGAPLTLCTDVVEAQARVDRCGARSAEECPVPLDVPARQAYPAPLEGAVNCRDVHVFEAAAGAHAARKVCDVEPETGGRNLPIRDSGGGKHVA